MNLTLEELERRAYITGDVQTANLIARVQDETTEDDEDERQAAYNEGYSAGFDAGYDEGFDDAKHGTV